MFHRTLANATDIHEWANRLEARALLPRVIRRLIQASMPGLIRLNIRADEGIQEPGWDGITETSVGHVFVPQGLVC
jgi:hypothetical protein